jgi:hypothetical protein
MLPFEYDRSVDYNLIILTFQPGLLSPSRAVDSFLQSAEAKQLLNRKPVVTIIACRNIWLNAQEKVKQRLHNTGANLFGNITFVDRSSNLISLITMPFMFEPKILEGCSMTTDRFYGDGFVVTGNVTEFLDRVFSSGVTLATVSGKRAEHLVCRQLANEPIDWQKD